MQHLIQELRHLAGWCDPDVPVASVSTSNMEPPRDRTDWIMLSLDHKHRPLITLHQLQFSTPPSNTELFHRLSMEYTQRREPYSFLAFRIQPFWRKAKAIHFVRFTTISPQPTMTVQIEDMHSLPHETHSWVWNRRNGIDASIMAGYLQEPSSAGEGWSVYEYIPKTRCPDLLSRNTGSEGWGLYVEEGVSRRSKLVCVITIATVAFLLEVWGLVQAKEAFSVVVLSVNVCCVGGIVAAALASCYM